MATPNTVLADINEIYTAYALNGKKWFSTDAKRQYNERLKQAQPAEVEDAIGKAIVMAEVFKTWAKNNKYSQTVSEVFWTARAGSMSSAVGYDVDQSKNPTDVLVKFSRGPNSGFLGLSAKATRGKADIGFKNPGVGTVDTDLRLEIGKTLKQLTEATIVSLDLPKAASARKPYIRANPGIKKLTEQIAVNFMSESRDIMMEQLKTLNKQQLLQYLLTSWMDADMAMPPYIKVTGMGSRPPYTAKVEDPLANPKMKKLREEKISLEKVGNESIGIKAGNTKIMKMRFKFESEKLASSLKMSGEPW